MLNKLYFVAILSITLFSNKQLFAQTNSAPDGIIFQAVATDPQGNPAAGRTIYIKDAVLQSTVNGQTVFSETFKVTASNTGVFTIVIGKGQKISGPNSINNLDWSVGPYFLNIKAAVAPSLPLTDWNADQQYVDMGTSQFWSVPFALYASNVAGFDLKLNISDTTNMLKPYLRKSDTASLSNRIDISNTAVAQEATRAIAAEALKANTTDVTTGLSLKANIASPTFTGTVGGIDKTMVGLGNVDNTSDANKPVSIAALTALNLKEDIANKSTTTALGTSDVLYPTQNAVKTYVDAQITSATIVDANTTTKGKLQLAGDLGGTSSLPTVLTVGGSTASNINAATNLANAASNTNTASTIVKRDASGNFSAGTITANITGNVTGDITGKATNVSGTVAVANGGTGATTLTGYIKGNGSNAFTTVSTIPSTDITGLVTKVNGTSPGADGNVSIVFGHVTSGVLSSKPADGTGANGDIYVVSGDGTSSNNGRTYIYNGTNWNETNTNQATTDARYLQLAGGTLSGNLIMPTNNIITLTDLPSSGTDAANKNYVDTKVSSATISDATVSVKGKLQLAGDLGGTADAPTVPGLALKEDIANKSTTTALGTSDVLYPTQNAVKTYVDAQITSATIVDANTTTKGKLQLAGDLGGTSSLPTVLTVGGSTASNINAATTLANAASNTNTASTIVKRDASGNFSAGTITANITGNVTGDVTGKATNVSGTVAVANGGTGATTLTGYIKGNGSNAFTTVSTIPSTDITGLVTKVNGTSPGTDGNVSIVFGHVTSGILSSKPADGTGTNGDIYVVSGDGILSNNGRTYIYNGTTWNEINTNQATTDARYLQLAGGTLSGNLIIPINNKITLTDLPISGTDAANKNYIDTKVSAASISDATVSIKGKLQLAGDLGGTGTTASAPVISDNAITTVKILDANITDAKIATLSGSKVTGDISGNAANVNGTVAIANGGTGATTKTAAFDALSPMTTSGDILYGGVSGTGTRLAKGTDGQILTLASGLPSWASNSGVPYTGATRAVDLGSYNLTVNGITLGSNGTSMMGASYSSIIFGKGATVGIGFSAAGESNAIGYNASAKGPQSIAIGSNASANQTQGLSIGYHSSIGTGYGLAIGSYTQSNGMYSVALGDFATTSANYSTAIGYQSAASGLNSVAIGENASTNIANQILLGNTDITNVKTSGTYTAGTVTYPNAHGTSGQVLSTTGSGALSWITPSTTATAYSGTLLVANGGTGSSTQNFVDLTTAQTIAGGKFFSADLNVNGITVGRGKFNENSNTAFGLAALSSNASYANTGIGRAALAANVNGNANTALGYTALLNNISGANNVSIGAAALQTNVSGSENTAIGNSADVASAALNNTTAIGNGATVSVSNSIQLGNSNITAVKTSGTITAGAVTYPNAHGTSGQVLSTTGTGALSWITPSTTATAYSGTLPVANGGTGAISATAALTNLGAAPIASPTFTGIPLAPTASAGTNTTQLATTSFVTTALSVAVREVADEFTATAAQISFTLTQTKSANSKVKMYINGIRISNTAYSVSGTTLTYTPANNGAYTLSASDRIQFDYYY